MSNCVASFLRLHVLLTSGSTPYQTMSSADVNMKGEGAGLCGGLLCF